MKRDRSVRHGAKRAVYTALIGRYEPLAEQPLAASSDTDFICLGIDDPGRVDEQRSHYADGGEARLGAAVPWTGMIARRSNGPVREAMDEWMRHVWRYSRCDQLSFVEAMARRDMPYRLIEIDDLESTSHRWLRRPASHAVVPAARSAAQAAAWTPTALADPRTSELA